MFENFTNFFRNEVNYLAGRSQEFEKLLEAGDIGRAMEKMTTRYPYASEYYKQYNPDGHEVNKRENKVVYGKLGNVIRVEKTAKLAVPYQQYINEMALAFLLGKPLTWSNKTDGCDDAFNKFREVVDHVHLNSRLRDAKRIAGSESESAILFRVYKDNDGKPDVLCKTLAASRGDKMYTRWDVYGNLLSFAWEYTGKAEGDSTISCIEIYTADSIYHCEKAKLGWEVSREENLIGKIPVIYFRQEVEWDGVQALIERNEDKHSRTADSNDYFEDPMLMLKADVIKSMPEKKEQGRTISIKGDVDLDKAGKFLTYDNASEAKKQEHEWLDETIMKMSFTPDITLDAMQQVAQMSAKALRTVLLLGYLKADRRKDTWDEMMERLASLILAIIGNVLDVSLEKQCKEIRICHQWTEPFGDDTADTIKNVSDAFSAGIMSEETAIEQNPLITDKELEKKRLKGEGEERNKLNDDIFNQAVEGAGLGN